MGRVTCGAPGLADAEDLTDWFVEHGKSAGDLKQLVREATRETP